MKLITRSKAHKAVRRGLKQGIRDYNFSYRLKEIRGMATQGAPKIKGMKKKDIWRLKNGGKICSTSIIAKKKTTDRVAHEVLLSLKRRQRRKRKKQLISEDLSLATGNSSPSTQPA